MSDPNPEEIEVKEIPKVESELERTERDIREITGLVEDLREAGVTSKRVESKDGSLAVDILLGKDKDGTPTDVSRPTRRVHLPHETGESAWDLLKQAGFNDSQIQNISQYHGGREIAVSPFRSVEKSVDRIIDYTDRAATEAVFVVRKGGKEETYWLGKTDGEVDLFGVTPRREVRDGLVEGRSLARLDQNIRQETQDRYGNPIITMELYSIRGSTTPETRNFRLDTLSSVTPDIKATLQSVRKNEVKEPATASSKK